MTQMLHAVRRVLRLVEANPPALQPGTGDHANLVCHICWHCGSCCVVRDYPELTPPATFTDCYRCGLTWEIAGDTPGRGAPRSARKESVMDEGNPMSRVLWEVGGERRRQDAKWGGRDHDERHGQDDWEELVEVRLDLAKKARGFPDRRGKWRRRMLQLAALAVAAVEWHDRQDAAT